MKSSYIGTVAEDLEPGGDAMVITPDNPLIPNRVVCLFPVWRGQKVRCEWRPHWKTGKYCWVLTESFREDKPTC